MAFYSCDEFANTSPKLKPIANGPSDECLKAEARLNGSARTPSYLAPPQKVSRKEGLSLRSEHLTRDARLVIAAYSVTLACQDCVCCR
jgi:hypothetical protein